jgi:hypothetical protein
MLFAGEGDRSGVECVVHGNDFKSQISNLRFQNDDVRSASVSTW